MLYLYKSKLETNKDINQYKAKKTIIELVNGFIRADFSENYFKFKKDLNKD